jgi:hypothetical protein
MTDIEVRRSGRTSSTAFQVTDANPTLAAGNGLINWSYKPEGISLTFQVNGGKGKSDLIVWIKPGAFADMAEKMLTGSPKEAEQAFLSALLKRSRSRAKGAKRRSPPRRIKC